MPTPATTVTSARCLVVDDDPQVRHAIARVIEAHGLATTEADGRTDILHGFHDGEAWYAYDLPSQGQWRVVAWQAGYRWPPGLPDGVRLSRPAPLYAACGLLP